MTGDGQAPIRPSGELFALHGRTAVVTGASSGLGDRKSVV